MKFNKTSVAVATTLAMGITTVSTSAMAEMIAGGNYTMEIQISPELVPGTGIPAVGTDGAWNSSFTFGGLPTAATSTGIFDNGTTLNPTPTGTFGSSIGGDGIAGTIGISVCGSCGNITFNSFNFDTIANTAGGNFAQEGGNLGLWVGSTSATVTTFNPVGRLGGIDQGTNSFFGPNPWNYGSFTTGSQTGPSGTLSGTAVTNIGDVNGDGIDDYTATFVSNTLVGEEWGPGFSGTPYTEVWQMEILSAPIPVPAAVWLMGSGLVGLVGVARRKRKTA
jgi:hypothetical protein